MISEDVTIYNLFLFLSCLYSDVVMRLLGFGSDNYVIQLRLHLEFGRLQYLIILMGLSANPKPQSERSLLWIVIKKRTDLKFDRCLKNKDVSTGST